MFRHRFRNIMETPDSLPSASEPIGFILVPCGWLQPVSAQQWNYQQALYDWAFQQAKAVMRPSIVERDLLGVWN